MVENGVIDKDSGSSTGLKIVVRALHGLLISFPCGCQGLKFCGYNCTAKLMKINAPQKLPTVRYDEQSDMN